MFFGGNGRRLGDDRDVPFGDEGVGLVDEPGLDIPTAYGVEHLPIALERISRQQAFMMRHTTI